MRGAARACAATAHALGSGGREPAERLARRIDRLLAVSGPVEPGRGGVGAASVSLAAIGVIAVIALAQAREGRSRSDKVEKPRPGGIRPPRV